MMNDFTDITEEQKQDYNNIVAHPLQSFEWGEFRKKTGVKVIRRGLVRNEKLVEGFTLTLHKIPRTKLYIGYLPKGNSPTDELIDELQRIGREENCIFIQLEPKVERGVTRSGVGLSGNEGDRLQSDSFDSGGRRKQEQDPEQVIKLGLRSAAHPLFTKYTFVLDLTKTEQELLEAMYPKTRYNIRVAEKHKVKVVENNSKESFEQYLKLMTETTARQEFYAHTPSYHRNMFEILAKGQKPTANSLSYHLLNATYDSKTLTSWVLFVFKDTVYYPYGASSRLHREKMASNLIMWEAIKFGKKLGLKYFDTWGALGPEPDKKDPWYGFHRFKEGYGGELVEFVGSYDLVIKPALYEIYKVADKLRWILLRLKSKIQ
ncbi:MAG: peptidoglycan bridge formation glycyltransferase FemA/FemB family protein [Candidatus Levybacteria bacterium]|nr:peptidoglycan bridge formation glycyltransferase FemA/FemB family protein [Candidatus Levybacteria bacterium]